MKSRWLSFSMVAVVLAFAACSDGDDDTDANDTGGSSNSGGASNTGGAGQGGSPDGAGGGDTHPLGFFVTSDTSATGDLGGLAGADERGQVLAGHVNAGSRTFKAYLSADSDPDNGGNPVDARDRIGTGPWYNAKGVLVAEDLDALHALPAGDAELFLDENGDKIAGQWEGSPRPVEHDILTGTNPDGTLAVDKTCESWTSSDAALTAVVGHSDGLGPMMNPAAPYNSWNSSHENMSSADTAPRGGAGRIYCFAVD